MAKIIFIVGLTGVGKSTTLEALKGSDVTFTLLPNRRKLTDEIIIPAMQQKQGLPIEPIKDRVKRFEFTRSYRKSYPSGMVQVLKTYLENREIPEGLLVFDSLRGVNEVKAGVEYFPNSRFVMLDASEEVRLQRLVGREDVFDQVGSNLLLENTQGLANIESVTDAKVARAIKIIQREKEDYDAQATAAYLKGKLSDVRLLYLDTSEMTIMEVRESITNWFSQSLQDW